MNENMRWKKYSIQKYLSYRDLPEQSFHDSAGPFVRLVLADKQKDRRNGEAKQNIISNTEDKPQSIQLLSSNNKDVTSVRQREIDRGMGG